MTRTGPEERTSTAPPPREQPDHTEEPPRKRSDQLPEERPASGREEAGGDAESPEADED